MLVVVSIAFAVMGWPFSIRAEAAARSRSAGFWFAFVTDSHLGSSQGNRWASAVVEDIRSYGLASGEQAAFIVHGGDMTEFGSREQYALYQESLGKAGIPLRGVPGNHESKWADAGKSGFTYALGPAFGSFDCGGVHFVLLDSSVSGETHGHLEEYMLDWMKQDIARIGGRPVMIFAHHPIGYEPNRFIDNDDDFLDAVGSHGIAAVFTGHGHTTLRWTMNGIPFYMGPAAMDGKYTIVKVEDGAVTILEKAVGSEPTLVAFTLLRGSGESVDRPALKAGARVVPGPGNASVEIEATLRGFSPASPLKYRIDLGPWMDLEARSNGDPLIYAGTHDASLLPDGAHTLRVRAECPGGGIWTARTEFTLDRSGGGKRILWMYQGRGGVQGTPALTDDFVIVGSNDGYLTAIGRSDGKVKWRSPAAGQVIGRPVVNDGRVYFGAASGQVYCLDAATGSKKWNYPAESSVVGGVTVSNGRVFAGTALGWVHCVNAASGEPVWKRQVGGPIRSTPALSDGSLFIGAWDGKVYRLSQRDGGIEWGTSIDSSPYYAAATGRPLVRDGRVYVTSAPNPRNGNFGVRALDAASGSVLWKSTVAAGYSDPFVSEGLLGVTTGQGNVCLLDPATGETKRTVNGGGPCLDSCAVPGPDGTFVLGTITGQIRVLGSPLDPQADRLVQSVQFGDGFIFAGIAVSGDEAYVSTMGGEVYAVNLAR